MSGAGVIADHESHPLFLPLVFVGGAVFGVGLAVSQMARPEIVLEFLQFRDFGLVFVMGGASAVAGVTFWALTRSGRSAPLTGKRFGRRLKSMDRDVIVGGGIFGAGWGLSGICPGAAYASPRHRERRDPLRRRRDVRRRLSPGLPARGAVGRRVAGGR